MKISQPPRPWSMKIAVAGWSMKIGCPNPGTPVNEHRKESLMSTEKQIAADVARGLYADGVIGLRAMRPVRAAVERALKEDRAQRPNVGTDAAEEAAVDEEMLSSAQWVERTGIRILDPDGWPRNEFVAAWEKPITRAEFMARAALSTTWDPEAAQ
jgi:hypothetical protein